MEGSVLVEDGLVGVSFSALDLPAEEVCRGELDILRVLDLPGEGPESIKMSEAGAGDKVKTAVSNGGKEEAGADDEAKARKKKKTVRVPKDTINTAMSWPCHGEPRRYLSDEVLDSIEDAKYRERHPVVEVHQGGSPRGRNWRERCRRGRNSGSGAVSAEGKGDGIPANSVVKFQLNKRGRRG